MLFTKIDLEKPRTIIEAAKFIYKIRKTKDRQEKNDIRLKKGIYRKYLQEYLPLFHYAINEYGIIQNIKIKANIGYENFDGTILDLNNKQIEQIEITLPVDGKKENKVARQLNEKGITDIELFGDENIIEYFKIVYNTAIEKSLKDYSKSTLVIAINTFPHISLDEREDMMKIMKFVEILAEIKFCAKKVVLLVLPVISSEIKTLGIIFKIYEQENRTIAST